MDENKSSDFYNGNLEHNSSLELSWELFLTLEYGLIWFCSNTGGWIITSLHVFKMVHSDHSGC